MDSARGVDRNRLSRDIEATRSSISSTVGELRERVGEVMHWETYVQRYPGAVLAGATLVGLIAGRALAHRFAGNGGTPGYQWGPGRGAEARGTAQFDAGRGESLAAARASWQRLGSRIETLVNRVIDEVGEAVERAVVPALVGSVQTLFEGRRMHPVHRPGNGREDRPSEAYREGSVR